MVRADPISTRHLSDRAKSQYHLPQRSGRRRQRLVWAKRVRRGAGQVVGSGAGCHKTAYRASSPPLNLISPSLDAAPSQYGERGVFHMDTVGQHLGLAAETLQILWLETMSDAAKGAAGTVHCHACPFHVLAATYRSTTEPLAVSAAATMHQPNGRVMCPPCSLGGTHQASGAANLLRKITDLPVRRSCLTKCCSR